MKITFDMHFEADSPEDMQEIKKAMSQMMSPMNKDEADDQ